jgi:aryl-alcohol dehydrogenase-like predicted oxidoreductase
VKQVALYQIHWPFPPISIETWMNALADAVELGLTQCVGVSNYNMDQMSRAIDALDKRGIKLASNQVVYNLLDRRIEKNGLLARCQEMNVSVIAYSPLAQGLLSGKYTIQNPPSGVRRFRYNANLIAKVQPLLNLMREMGQEQGGKTPTQIALNWVISKGAIPIPGVKNRQQAMEVVGALGWHLSSEQMDALDKVSQEVSL